MARPSTTRSGRFRGGFTFTEILFAVMLLGIGFVMLAGMFPVAIHQTQQNVQEASARSLAQATVAELRQRAEVFSAYQVGDPLYGPLNLADFHPIMRSDPRIAVVPVYHRAQGSNQAHVIVFCVQVRNTTEFSVNDLSPPGGPIANLQPRPLLATITAPDTIEFDGNFVDAVAENAFVVVADDNTAQGFGNGRIYRIGRRVTGNLWQLAAGYHLAGAGENLTNATVYVMGRGLRDPSSAWDENDNPFEGPAMDIGIYSATIVIRN
jgi:Tfp pilus assembly protein PilV